MSSPNRLLPAATGSPVRFVVPVLCWLLFMGIASAIPVTQAEYFLDTYVAPGAGIPIPITRGETVNVSTTYTTNLSDGFHWLYTRVCDSTGVWGIPTARMLWHERLSTSLARAHIVAAEYYFDCDTIPFFTGSPILVPDADSIGVSFTAQIPLGMSEGFHQFSVRLRDEFGKRGFPVHHLFWVTGTGQPNPAAITAAEVFFDSDPGNGHGTPITITNPGVTTEQSYVVNLSSVTPGYHTMFTRVRDVNNNWSVATAHAFWVGTISPTVPNVSVAEYFFDTDPGPGHGTPVTLNNGTIVDTTIVINLSNVALGYHSLGWRVRDQYGMWGMPIRSLLWVDRFSAATPSVVRAEYYIDEDPGYGVCNSIPLTASDTVSVLNFSLDISRVDVGYHNICVRTQDQFGHWSLPTMFRAYVNVPPSSLNTLMVTYSPGHANLSWVASTGTIIGYKIYRSSTAYFSPSTATLLTTVGSTTTAFSDATNGLEYYYVLTVYDNNSDSEGSTSPAPGTTTDGIEAVKMKK